MARTIADELMGRLIAWGVDTIFGLPRDGVNGLFEALRTHQDKIRFIQVRHEEAAAFAAVGYAKYTGRLGVCLATSGPGGIHLLNGLYDGKCDGQPCSRSPATPMTLSQARAEAVVQALTAKHGVAAARLKGYGVGPLAPVASNGSEEGRAKNRRVELVAR